MKDMIGNNIFIKTFYSRIQKCLYLNLQEVNEYLGFKVEELSTSDNSWVEKFVNPIVYVDSERQEFIGTFVKVE